MLRLTGLAAAAVCGLMLVSAAPASAQVCARGPATAQGRPSLTNVTARFSARRAWRGSVRATKGLGPSYANIRHAKGVRYVCRNIGQGIRRRVVCRLTALPCRR